MSRRLATAALGLAAALLLPRSGVAQSSELTSGPSSQPAAELTLEEALAVARQRSPALLEAAGRVAEAAGPVAGASPPLRNNPTVDLEAGPDWPGDGTRGLDLSVALTQTFELGGKQGARQDSASASQARETSQQRDMERRVLGDVASTFLRALHARERLALARDTETAAASTAKSAQRRFEAGDVPVVDVNMARVALARARADVAAAEGTEASLLYILRALLGLGLARPVVVRGELRALALRPVAPPSGDTVRPDIAALESELAQAKADLRLGQSAALTDIDVGVRYDREVDERSIVGTLSVPLPLFSRGQEARVTGEARVRRLQTALDSARAARELSVEAAGVQYRKRQEAMELLEREALPLLADNESLARRSYDAGEMGLAEFLLVRRDTLEARGAYIDSLLDAALARVQLAVETGAQP